MLSYWHVHARDYTRRARENPHVEIAAVWDEDPERGRAQAEALGVRFHERLDDLLADPEISAVVVDCPTTGHRDVIVAAAGAGKHVFTEKVLAPTLEECSDILDAVERARVVLTVSLPRLNEAPPAAILRLVEDGALGQVTEARARISHNGAVRTDRSPEGWLPKHFFEESETAGGALIDLGCHAMYLTRRFLGMPEGVSASYGHVTGREVEDNAVSVLRYSNGALGVVEAGFVNAADPFTLEVHGTEGAVFYGSPYRKVIARTAGDDDWRELGDLPEPGQNDFDRWVDCIRSGRSDGGNVSMAVDLTALMQGSNLSAREGRPVRLDELPGWERTSGRSA